MATITIFHGNNTEIYTDAKSDFPKEYELIDTQSLESKSVISQLAGISLFGDQKAIILNSLSVEILRHVLAYEFSRESYGLCSTYLTKEEQKHLQKLAQSSHHNLSFVEKKAKAKEIEKTKTFEFLTAFFAKEKKKAWTLFPAYENEKETILFIGSFWWAIKTLLCIKKGETAEISEYTLRQYTLLEKKWTEKELYGVTITLLEHSEKESREVDRHRKLEMLTLSL